MADPIRVSPQEAWDGLQSSECMLVLSYSNPAAFKKFPIEGAIPFPEFQSRLPSIPKEQEIVFYCG